jgi:hypothetical protein
MVDRSVEARLVAAKARKRDLLASEASLRARLNEVEAELGKADEEIGMCEAAMERATSAVRANRTADAELRRIVKKMGQFTAAELATELGVTRQTAKRRLDIEVEEGRARPLGVRVFGSPLYEYVKPTDAGDAFHAQQFHRPYLVEDVGVGASSLAGSATTGTGRPAYEMIAAKEVREACKQAMLQGWKLTKKGDGHFLLQKDGRRLGVAGTPKNPSGTADLILRSIRKAS